MTITRYAVKVLIPRNVLPESFDWALKNFMKNVPISFDAYQTLNDARLRDKKNGFIEVTGAVIQNFIRESHSLQIAEITVPTEYIMTFHATPRSRFIPRMHVSRPSGEGELPYVNSITALDFVCDAGSTFDERILDRWETEDD